MGLHPTSSSFRAISSTEMSMWRCVGQVRVSSINILCPHSFAHLTLRQASDPVRNSSLQGSVGDFFLEIMESPWRPLSDTEHFRG